MPPFDFVGPYKLGDKLGQGGMGSVYRAVHAKSKEAVAVKIIAAQVADEPRFRRRFDAEVKTLMSLQHPGIVKLIGFGEEHGQLFYSMELVEGDSLQSLIKSEKKLNWRTCIDFTIDICAALKHAHDVGVIHRDLKPANLIVTDDKHLKLVDFGIAKIFGDVQQTVIGSMLGTLDYMAPEQVDSSSITVRTDLYAVGSVMYAMLTGRPPFRGKNATQVLDMLKNQPPARLDLIDPDLPEPLVELVHELLEKNPSDRPPTSLSVSKRLKAMRAGLEKILATEIGEQSVIPSDTRDGNNAEVSGETRATPLTEAVPNQTAVGDTQSSPTDHLGTNAPDASAATEATQFSDANLTRGSEDLTQLNESQVASVRAGNSIQQAPTRGPSPATQVAQTIQTANLDSDQFELAPELQTHFQEAEVARQSERQREAEQTHANHWPQRLGIAAMVVVLIVGLYLLLQAMQPPTADELYQQTLLPNSGPAQRAFVKNFPDDPRRVQVEDTLMLAKLEAATKRISMQNNIGIKEISSAEVAFLSVFTASDLPSDQQLANDRLKSINDWLTSFGEQSGDDQLTELIELVQYEANRIQSGRPDPRMDPRLRDLTQQIRSIPDDANDKKERLESLINLFKDETWAEPAISEARTRLGQSESDDE